MRRALVLALPLVLLLTSCGKDEDDPVVPSVPTGDLTVQVTGLPMGGEGDVTVTGPHSFEETVTTTSTLEALAVGNYQLQASNVNVGGDDFTPAPAAQQIDVTQSETASADVDYQLVTNITQNLTLERMYLVQSTQRLSGSVPMVANRDAMVRAFVSGAEASSENPIVRLEIYDGNTLVDSHDIQREAPGIDTSISEADISRSYNVVLPAAQVGANLRVLATVDPDGVIAEFDGTDNTYPSDGDPQDIDVRAVPAMGVQIIPVRQTSSGLTGDVTSANKDSYLDRSARVFPVANVTVTLHPLYTSSAPTLQNDNANGAWGAVVSEILALRMGESPSLSVNYYGVVKTTYGSGVAGVGYVPSSPSQGVLAAVGWDRFPSAPRIAAHELGHNFGRSHATCGGAADADPNFPYSGGSIGVYGLDVSSQLVYSPNTNKDMMGYCTPAWISDYTFEGVLNFRSSLSAKMFISGGGNDTGSNTIATTLPSDVLSSQVGSGVDRLQPGLLVWGRITERGPVLEPSFWIEARPHLPTGGSYRLEGKAANGRAMFALDFEPLLVADLPSGPERHFAFVLPMSAAQAADLGELSIDGREGRATRHVRPAQPSTARSTDARSGGANPGSAPSQLRVADFRAVRAATGARLEWDPEVHPMVMVRDPSSGAILSFARGGAATIAGNLTELQLEFSDGLRSETLRTKIE